MCGVGSGRVCVVVRKGEVCSAHATQLEAEKNEKVERGRQW